MYGSSDDGHWSLRSDGAYTRPCGHHEQYLYWSSQCNNGTNVLEHLIVDVRPDIPVQNIFNRQNVTRAWVHLKRMYPLLGAQVEEQDGRLGFIVFEKDLNTVRPDELVFGQVSSDEQVDKLLHEIEETPISPRHLSKMLVFARSDVPQRVHVMIHVVHYVTDATAQAMMKTMLLDLLARDRPITFKFEDRLAMSLSTDALSLSHPRNSPRQRWRSAIAAVISQQRPVLGGHTLPRKVTTATPYSKAVPHQTVTALPPDISAEIVAGCKKIGITFGRVFPVIGQVATTRLLFRHYMQGKISEEEWEFRKREPMHITGGINIRSKLDAKWYKDGGKHHFCTSVSFCSLTLPYMPLGELANVKPHPEMASKTPHFSSFLSYERFLLRAQMVGKQLDRFLTHPLFFENAEITNLALLHRSKESAIKSREEQKKPESARTKGEVLSAIESSQIGPVLMHSGLSWGVMDDAYPTSFPLQTKAVEGPVLELESQQCLVYCTAAFLRLGSIFYHGKVYMVVYWDGAVYEEDIVKEFMEEVCEAAKWYLARGGEGLNVVARL